MSAHAFSFLSDLFLIATLGFLGSFGHCAGMCSPIALAFSLNQQKNDRTKVPALNFHLWLNFGRLLSYGTIGGAIGAIAEVLIAGGQLAGIDSSVRRGIAITTGIILILFGLSQLGLKLNLVKWFQPFPKNSKKWDIHNLLLKLPQNPLCLGITWGLMPCGFLYAAQIKAAETASFWAGSATMLAFGLGTLPVMVGVGVFSSHLSSDKRGQLSKLGGWLTVAIGVITLLRTGDMMVDYSGHGALILLSLALVARPIKAIWAFPYRYRRGLGVGAFGLGLIHTLHMFEHSWGWNPRTLLFMLPSHQVGMWAGILAMCLIAPAAMTSFDRAVQNLGNYWRKIHLLTVPALILTCTHVVLIGSHYLGKLAWEKDAVVRVLMLLALVLLVLAMRSPWIWKLFAVERYYTPAQKPVLME